MRFGAKLALFFFVFYALFGLYLFVDRGTPNATNDFVFHYYKVLGGYDNPELFEAPFAVATIEAYPDFFHEVVKPFVFNKFWLYFVAVVLVCLVAPLLLYKIAGDFAVILYFSFSLPHMVLYNATFPSFLVFIYILIYFLHRKDWVILALLTALASVTHGQGLSLFLLIWFAEIVSMFFSAMKFQNNFAPAFLTAVAGLTFQNLANIFLVHLNFYFVWVARKRFEIFYLILFLVGVVSVYKDFRVIALSQLVICVVAGGALKEQKPTKLFWLLIIIFTVLNFFNFVLGTARFLY